MEVRYEKLFEEDDDIYTGNPNASVNPPTSLCGGRRKED